MERKLIEGSRPRNPESPLKKDLVSIVKKRDIGRGTTPLIREELVKSAIHVYISLNLYFSYKTQLLDS